MRRKESLPQPLQKRGVKKEFHLPTGEWNSFFRTKSKIWNND